VRAFVIILLLSACSHSAVMVGNAQPVAPTSGVHVNATNAVGAAVLIGVAATAATMSAPQPAPTMATDRDVNLQDCTQPIDMTGNLRCR